MNSHVYCAQCHQQLMHADSLLPTMGARWLARLEYCSTCTSWQPTITRTLLYGWKSPVTELREEISLFRALYQSLRQRARL